MRRLALVVAVLAATLAAPVTAPASPAPFSPELEADYAFAEAWWGAQPTSCVSVAKEMVPLAELGNYEFSTQPSPGVEASCVMEVAEDIPGRPCRTREAVVHGYGHLLGLGHSSDPRSIMYPTSTGYVICRAEDIQHLRDRVRRVADRCRAMPRNHSGERYWCHRERSSWRRMLRLVLNEPPEV